MVSVFDSGASDLLQVKLDSVDILDATGKQKSEGARVSDHLVWIPFVEAIVPNVDLNKREMHITPPKGLLELNLRFDDRSKKERRQLVRHTLLLSFTYLSVQCCRMPIFVNLNVYIKTISMLISFPMNHCWIWSPVSAFDAIDLF